MGVTFHRGPLGYGVCLNGRPSGRINRYQNFGNQYLVSVPGLNPGVTPGQCVFPNLAAAKAAVINHLTKEPS